MTISISSKTLSDYDANLAYNTASAFLRKSDLANYLIDQLEQQRVKLNIEVSTDPALANQDVSNNGAIVWNLHSNLTPGANLADVTALLNRIPAQQKPYITSLWTLMHLLALACQQLNNQLNFRDADATWPWLDEKVLSANDIENVVARELSDLPLPDEQNWNRLLNRT
ncbi:MULTISPECIES: hypothetical protein [Pseudomonas]|uniref:Uncharacterized protein n=2 Tax=Pseudomonas TaxID=286 RepID=A0A9Q5FNH2_PSEFR|nr:hypothetical protein [Pseudomonas fragi]ARQ76326.1 hypothetical protein B6D87_19870 [Pseudomonas fragi]MBM1201778.1 hypothetical protein [Pseudomonas fragi]MBM1206863.1 hypothetical protein [Pseudomonas fragi]MDE4514994.1 hypothetical protein [Pseudomonas fragi]NNA87448.1 hypothetical protein [Pseudomonas fragi]